MGEKRKSKVATVERWLGRLEKMNNRWTRSAWMAFCGLRKKQGNLCLQMDIGVVDKTRIMRHSMTRESQNHVKNVAAIKKKVF